MTELSPVLSQFYYVLTHNDQAVYFLTMQDKMRFFVYPLLTTVVCMALSAGAIWLYAGTIRLPQALISPGSPLQNSTMSSMDQLDEVPVTLIPLNGPVSRPDAELSGLAWYGDWLILLPQYPARFGQDGGVLFALNKSEIINYLNGRTSAPLKPREIPLVTGGVEDDIWLFEGFEAIAFLGEQVFMTIEARNLLGMKGYLISGRVAPDLSEMRLEPASLVENKPQMNLGNKSDEALLIVQDSILTLYEANGALNSDPHATRFALSLQPQGRIPFPHLEYRLTDATAPDAGGRFWVLNVHYFGERALEPSSDPLAERYGEGATHARSTSVERLVELQYHPNGITFTETPPVQLELVYQVGPRNWEGLALLDGLGFLLVTDKFPGTLLSFVPYH